MNCFIKDAVFAALICCTTLPAEALWRHEAGGAKWHFTYTGTDNKCALIDGITEVTSTSLAVPSVVWHDGSTNTQTWPVVALDLYPNMRLYGRGVTSVYSPSCVKTIAGSSFQDCDQLLSVSWGSEDYATYSAGDYMFSSCSNLVDVTLPTTLSSMGRGVFKDCVRLQVIVLPPMLDMISKQTFWNCRTLGSVKIPDNVMSIGDSAFRGCVSLGAIAIPQRTTTIGEYAFYGCSSLKCVIIPEGVTSVGAYAFANCSGLEKAFVPISLKGQLGKYHSKETAFSDMSVVEYYDGSVSHPITTSDGMPMAIEKSWLDENAAPYMAEYDGDYEKTANAKAANGMKVWECYVAGLNPTDSDNRFEARIEIQNGHPVITWNPNLNVDEQKRVYTIYGNEKLNADGWTSPTNSLHRFFKVGVEMP